MILSTGLWPAMAMPASTAAAEAARARFPDWTEFSLPPCPYVLLIYLFSSPWSSWTVSFMETD